MNLSKLILILIKIKSTNPLKFQLFSSNLIEYSVIDIFKIYFDFLIRMVEGDTETVLFL